MIDFSQILLRSQMENNAIESLMNSSSSGTFTSNTKNEKIYKIEIPFHQCHKTSTSVKIENNVLFIEAKLVSKDNKDLPLDNSDFQQQRMLPDNVDSNRMVHSFNGNYLNIEIPLKTEIKSKSENIDKLMRHITSNMPKSNLQNNPLKYSIENGQYVISEDLGISFVLPKIFLKISDDLLLSINVYESSSDFRKQTSVNLKREYRLRSDLYDIKNTTTQIVENQTLKIYVPIKRNNI